MAFVRFSRDKRGYEHTYLVHESGGRGRPVRARVLYWFRTPPGIKVGREPFDDEARRKIESQHPGIAFDWNAIASTPMPPVPEVEHWRERRRMERAAKVARRQETPEPESTVVEAEAVPVAAAIQETAPAPEAAPPDVSVEHSEGQPAAPAGARKRRRRRGGRRRRPAGEAETGTDSESGSADAAAPDDERDFGGAEPSPPAATADGGPRPADPAETGAETSQD